MRHTPAASSLVAVYAGVNAVSRVVELPPAATVDEFAAFQVIEGTGVVTGAAAGGVGAGGVGGETGGAGAGV
jgi:hypothetical protein